MVRGLLASPCTLKGSGYEGVWVFGWVWLRQVSPTQIFCTVGSLQPVHWSTSGAITMADQRLVKVGSSSRREIFLFKNTLSTVLVAFQ